MMSLEEEVQVLSRVEILEPLSSEELRELLRQSPDTHLNPGETFYTPEDTTENLFILKKGRVRIYRQSYARELTLAEIEPATIFGEMALTAQRLRGSYAQALEPSILITMSRADLEHLMLKKPQVGIRITHLLSERLHSYEERMEDLGLIGHPRPPSESHPPSLRRRGGDDSYGYQDTPSLHPRASGHHDRG